MCEKITQKSGLTKPLKLNPFSNFIKFGLFLSTLRLTQEIE